MANEMTTEHRAAEVPSGYKRTEIGVIPEDWKIKHLTEVCMPGGIVRGPFGGALKKETFVNSGFKVYEQRNAIYKNCEIGEYFVDQAKYNEMHRFRITPGDFIISCSGTIGRIYQVPQNAPPGIINQALLKLTLNADVVDKQYFYNLFESDNFQARIIDSTQGGAMKNLVGMDVFRTTPVVLPPIHEQRAIAEVLSDVDELIEALDKLIAKKRAIKQAAMQQLLTGKTRQPGFSVEWETKRLGEIISFQVGFPFSSRYFTDEVSDVRLVKNRDLKSDDEVTYYAGPYSDNYVVHNGDVLIGMDGDFLPCVWRKGEALLNQRVGRVLRRNGADLRFMYYYLIEPLKEIERATSSTTVKHLSHGDVEGIVGCIPEETEQTAIATVLSDMDTEIDALEKRRNKIKQIKQGMMQQLLTGRIRLVKSSSQEVPA